MGGAKHGGVGVGEGEEVGCGYYHIQHGVLAVAQPIGRQLPLDVVQESKLKDNYIKFKAFTLPLDHSL